MTAAFHLTFDDKRSFFDRPLVDKSIDRARFKALGKAGAFVRRTARKSIRRTKTKISAPGEPPRAHGPEPNIRTILFAYDPKTQSVVVGPVKLNGNQGDVPALLEFGGSAVRQFFLIDESGEDSAFNVAAGRFVSAKSGRFISGKKIRYVHSRKAPKRTVQYKPRPFMGPALEKEAPGFQSLWGDSLPKAA